MVPAYNQSQTNFFLSMLSNLAITQKGTADAIEAFLAGRIDAHLQASVADIGVWTRVWGPAVFQAPLSQVADNVMYVAQSATTPPQYVVAIAGTNYNSIFDVLIEDFFVGSQVTWAYGHPPAGTSPKISAGTYTGLTLLQFMTPGPGMPGAPQKVADFLASVATQPIDVITTGHSLGGALAPTLALWLLNTQATWDPQGRATIYCEPSAGPTSGNADFANYYDQALGSHTTRIVNSLDMVPHAWNAADLASLPALYEPDIEPDLVVYGLAAAAAAASSGGDYTQIDPSTPPLTGTVDTSLINPNSYAFENFLVQAGDQHINEYFTLLGVTISTDAMAAVTQAMGSPAAVAAAPRLRAQLVRRQVIPAEATV
jgi:Lipase (class 3)